MIYYMGDGYTCARYFKQLNVTEGYFLETFYAIRGKDIDSKMNIMLSYSKKVIIDSGAFTFMHNAKSNLSEREMDTYFKEYCNFINKYKDNPKIEGFFELDIDRVFGVEKAMYYLQELTKITDKIIPVWHNTRSIDFYYYMCKNYKKVAITQAILSDVYFEQVNYFINTVHKYGAKIHLLGFARLNEVENLNLEDNDSFDAVSYVMTGAFGNIKMYNLDERLQFTFDLGRLNGLNSIELVNLNTFYHLELQKKLNI